MKPIADFFKGLTMQHVDYSTRHHSRAYDIGGIVAVIVFLVLAFIILSGPGFIVGRLTS